jgi:hypothetical protein
MKLPISIKSISALRSRYQITPKIATGLGLSLLFGLGFTLTAAPASARHFTKLLEVGKKVPGSNRPIASIIDPTIGLDGQVAVQLTMQPVETSTLITTFSGIYAIPKGRSVRLLEGGSKKAVINISTEGITFVGPSISSGQIAYMRVTESRAANGVTSDFVTLRVGTPGNVRTILNLPPDITGILSNSRRLAYVNGKVYFVGKSRSLTITGFPAYPVFLLGVIDTQSAHPSFDILNQDFKNQAVAASANTIVLTQAFPRRPEEETHFESTGDSNFQEIVGFPGCRNFSTSHESLAASCVGNPNGSTKPAVKLRFGRQGVPFGVPTPNVIGNAPSLVNPSLSNRSVLYLRKRLSTAPDDQTRLYLSQYGQAPITLLKEGDKLNGKKVSTIGLGESGRTLAGNSAVFTASFQDSSVALYRVDW